ncbi:MAG: hypothetical protein ACK4WB_05095 [Desulfatiglandales bacterium]
MARVYGEGKLEQTRPRIALTLFGFITVLKEQLKGPKILYSDAHINEKRFALDAVNHLVQMLLPKEGVRE